MSQISSKKTANSGVIPYEQLRAIFLDAGNTLVEMDFALFARRLEQAGVLSQDPGILARAEAAIRPAVSRRLATGASSEDEDSFAHHMRLMLEQALRGGHETPPANEIERGVRALRALAREPGASERIWSVLRPETRAALEALHGSGLPLVVVSNSDGSIGRVLHDRGLTPYFAGVLDSAIVGFEKPDPEIFRRGLEIAGTEPEQTLHVGDLYAIDVVGARSAGCHAVLLDPYGDWKGWDCERVPDLATLVGRLRGAA